MQRDDLRPLERDHVDHRVGIEVEPARLGDRLFQPPDLAAGLGVAVEDAAIDLTQRRIVHQHDRVLMHPLIHQAGQRLVRVELEAQPKLQKLSDHGAHRRVERITLTYEQECVFRHRGHHFFGGY